MTGPYERVLRTIERANMHAENLTNAHLKPDEMLEAWENFLLHWKQSIEQFRKIANDNGLAAQRAARHAERETDAALNYAWEARNFEEHDTAGSSEAEPVSRFRLVMKPGGRIDSFVLNGDFGEALKNAKMSGVTALIDGGDLILRPVPTRSGAEITPPTGVSASDIVKRCCKFMSDYAKDVGVS